MGTTDSILSLLVLGGVGYVAYQMIQSGQLQLPNIFAQQAATGVEEEEFETPEIIQCSPTDIQCQQQMAAQQQQQYGGGYLPTNPYQFPAQQTPPAVVPPTYSYPPQQPQYPLTGPPGSVSSLYYMQTPSGPPYISQTVGTYSQYSPYNQFYQYSQEWTQPWGAVSSMPDDNTNFSDIRTDTAQCRYCKRACERSKYGSTCRACRMTCKQYTHQYITPKQYWDITPAGGGPISLGYQPVSYSPYYPQRAYLGMIADTILGGGGKPTFLEMDDYHQGRRFDPHNKLKRRPRRSHEQHQEFVTREDYWDNPTRINFNVE